MKKILLASAATAAMTAAAYADGHEGGVTVTGDGRMGLVYNEANEDNEFEFDSRIRIKFAASGQTDSGLAFGGEIRADNAASTTSFAEVRDDVSNELTGLTSESTGGGVIGQAGSVFISGTFGKLSMGDVDGAAKAAVGHVDGVGYTGLGDTNESAYIANGGLLPKESALYEYDTGSFGFKASIGQPSQDGDEVIALGVKYSTGDYVFALGYENNEALDTDHIILGADATFGDITVKGRVGSADDVDQFALSGTYSAGGTAFTAFYNDIEDANAVGLGASYDLGGGATLKGGIVQADNGTDDNTVADFGLTFDF